MSWIIPYVLFTTVLIAPSGVGAAGSDLSLAYDVNVGFEIAESLSIYAGVKALVFDLSNNDNFSIMPSYSAGAEYVNGAITIGYRHTFDTGGGLLYEDIITNKDILYLKIDTRVMYD